MQANAQEVEQAIKDWQKKAARTESVHYQLEGKVTITQGHISRAFPGFVPEAVPVPVENYTDKTKTNWHIDLSKNWYRKEVWTPMFYAGKKLIFYPSYEVTCFDGEDYVSYRPRKENTSAAYTPSANQPDLTFRPNRLGAHSISPDDYPILFAHGIVPFEPISLENLRASVKPAVLNYDRKEKKDGRLYHVLKTQARGKPHPRVDEIWVDPERESAIGHWKRWANGSLTTSLSIEYVDRKGVWLPREWSFSLYDENGQLGRYHHHVVKEAVVNPVLKQADFRIKLRCDMIVSDVRE